MASPSSSDFSTPPRSGLLPSLFPQLFTKSEAVIELMNQAIPFMSLSLFAHTGSMASEGCLLAARDGVFMSPLRSIPNSILSCITLTILSARGFGVQSSWIACSNSTSFGSSSTPFALRTTARSARGEETLAKLEEQARRRRRRRSRPSTHLPRERANERHDVRSAANTHILFLNSW